MGSTNEFDDVMRTLSEDEILMLETILSQVSETGSSKALDDPEKESVIKPEDGVLPIRKIEYPVLNANKFSVTVI